MFGFLLRAYAKTESEIDLVVKRTLNTVAQIGRTSLDLIDQTIILVPKEKDCGNTAERIWQASKHVVGLRIEQTEGNAESDALNAGMRMLVADRTYRAVVVSNKAASFVNGALLNAMAAAFDKGAMVIGVATDELASMVLEGRVQNTLAAWDAGALLNLTVPGFDSKIGVEEAAPTVRLLLKFGRCIAILNPTSGEFEIRPSKDGLERYAEIMRTKTERQLQELARVSANFEILKQGIMYGYPLNI
jgi:hypothetical protein